MTKTTTVASKAFVAIVAAAMVFSLVAPAAKAATAEELQAQIATLMAQITALQGGTTTTTTTTTSTCTAIPAPLTMNASGANVMALQNYLISKGQSIPAGATGFFGAQTRSALAAWQTANGVMPAVGYYGPVTAAKMAAMCTPTTPTTPGGTTTTTTTTGTTATLKGEASLDKFDINDADDTDVSEGDSNVEIGKIMVKFQNGDASISRLDLRLTDIGGTISTKPWDAFDTLTLMVDGKKVGEVDASSKSDYLGTESQGILRFSDLKIVGMEDEEVEITVMASIQDNLGSTEIGNWKMKAVSLRFFDASDVATTEIGTPVIDDQANFNIEVAGQNEELKYSLSSSNPAATDILVDKDKTTNNVSVLEYKIKAVDGDITLNKLYVKLTTGATSTNVISDIKLDVDGTTFNDASAATTSIFSTDYMFNVDGDVVINKGDDVTVKVMVNFKRQGGAGILAIYNNGTTVKAEVTSVLADATDAEGADTLTTTQITGAAIGNVHTLVASGISLDVNSTNATPQLNATTPDASFGEYKINFDVTAVEDTAYVPLTAARTSGAVGAVYQIEDGNGIATTSGTVSQSLSRKSGGTVSGGFVEIAAGDTATFELIVTFNPATGTGGQYRVQLLNAGFNDTSATTPNASGLAIPAEDFETSNTNITS